MLEKKKKKKYNKSLNGEGDSAYYASCTFILWN